MPRRVHATGAAAACLVAAAGLAAAGPASAATGQSAYTGFSNGTVAFANAADLPPVDVARVGVGQAAAGVELPGPLSAASSTDQLRQPLLAAPKAGKTAYGHGSGLNAGLLSAPTAAPQLAQTLVEATSPAPSKKSGELLALPDNPLLTATVLPGKAEANTTSDGACVTGKDISNGMSSVVRATALQPDASTAVVKLDDTSTTTSSERLVGQVDAKGNVVASSGAGLLSQSTQTLAPLTLFKGTPAELTITALGPIQLSAAAGGVPGTAVVSYGMPGKSGSEPVLTISGGGQTQTLTADQVFGAKGFVIPLGVADVTIGSPAHSLTGLEHTAATTSSDGTQASAAADFIRVTVPGKLATPGTDPLDGPLAGLNQVLNPVLAGLDPLLSQLQDGLTQAGLNVADVRIGHLEASSAVPAGGIQCAAPAAAPVVTGGGAKASTGKTLAATGLPVGVTTTGLLLLLAAAAALRRRTA